MKCALTRTPPRRTMRIFAVASLRTLQYCSPVPTWSMKMTWARVGVPEKQSAPVPEPPLTLFVRTSPKPGVVAA